MKLSDFNAGIETKRLQYSSFEPSLINHPWEIDNSELNLLLSKANLKLGELKAFSQLIPDVDFFVKMHIFKEGTQSSRIEGTQTNIDDAIQNIDNIKPERRDDWQEVNNYVQAMNTAIAELENLPLSSRLIRQTHHILLQGVRGEHKLPGEFRRSQNWIGGASLADAKYIPPHHDGIGIYMTDLETFLHNNDLFLPSLVKIGIAHYQFETIHPFCDGNGRIGRLLITLFLISNGLLTRPTLYLSDYLEKNRQHYYDNLSAVRSHNDLTQWLKFFLVGIEQTATNAIDTLQKIIALRESAEAKLLSLGKKVNSAKILLNGLYSEPIIDAGGVSALTSLTPAPTNRLISDFIRLGILTESTGYKRNRIYIFKAYMQLFQ